MASAAPPTGEVTKVPSQFELGDLPNVSSANPESDPIDQFKLAVSKLIAEVWNEPLEKVFNGVDTGMQHICRNSSFSADVGREKRRSGFSSRHP